jgi:DNA-binding CsgD family transcriptional regulator
MRDSITPSSASDPLDALTPRQREVGELLAAHYSQKEIAAELGISEDRVQRQVAVIKAALRVQSRREIAERFRATNALPGAENPVTGKTDLPENVPDWPEPALDEPQVLQRSDDQAMNFMPHSFVPPERPRIVPRLLDGKYRVLVRLAVVVTVMVFVLFTTIIAVAAIRSVTEIVGGSAPDKILDQRRDPSGSVGRH